MSGNNGPLSFFGDFGFYGGQDVAPNPLQNQQICINFYSEINPQNAKEQIGLLGCPGLVELVADPAGGSPGFSAEMTAWPAQYEGQNLPVRGMWPLPNYNTALVVIADTCYLVSSIPVDGNFPELTLTKVGTLSTKTGVVNIRDNGVNGGTAVLVDGPNGYYYDINAKTFTKIDDPNFLGATHVAYIDGWWIFNQPGTQKFYTNAQQYSKAFNALNFATKDAASDSLIAIIESKELLWLIGERSTEVWVDSGGQYFAFQRLTSTLQQMGCKAANSVCRITSEGQEGLIWFGRNERGENVIIKTAGFLHNTVSTPAFSNEVSRYPITSDAIAYTYQEDTHEFYVITFPSADVTWCFDTQSGLLHKRLSYDPYVKLFHRHRSNCYMNFQGMRIVGDYQCGSLYNLTRDAYTDSGWPLLAKRRAPHVWDKGQRGRVFMGSLQLDFDVGVGNPRGFGADPQCHLSMSRDGGNTFGPKWPAPLGRIGQFRTRAMWRRLGWGRDNVIDVEVIDPIKRDLIGVTLRAFSAP